MTTAPKFEFEDGSPATPTKPDQGTAPAAAFNPFAEQKVDLSPKAMVAAAVAAAGPVAEAPVVPGGDLPPAPGAPVAAPGAIGDEAGAGRDLWHCPHCGSGNQKKRTTCRACGKDPLDAVKQPWFRTVPAMAGMAGAVVLLVIILVVAMKTDKSLHPAGPAGVDKAVRTWGSGSDVEEDLGEKRGFRDRGKAAVSGRVAGAKSLPGYPWITTVVLVLGNEAKDDLQAKSWTTNITDRDISSTAANYVVVHCLFDEKVELPRGSWLSLKGAAGYAMLDATIVPFTQGRGHVTLRVAEHQIER